MKGEAPKEWFSLLEFLAREKGKVLVLGATDTGKSTLVKFLLDHLCRRGLTIALVDTDIGQSFLGPPTTIGFSLFKCHPDWGLVFSTPQLFFVGSTTPEGHLPIFLKGVEKMVGKAASSGADLVLVDTTGFVSGEGGRELKKRKIELVSPRALLALQRNAEIEPILEGFQKNPAMEIFRLPVSPEIRIRSMEERRAYRNGRFREYFRSAHPCEIPLEGLQFENEVRDPDGQTLPLDWALKINGLLVGLKDIQEETLGLGLIRFFYEKEARLRILTPLQEIHRIKTIQLSSQKVILSPEEAIP
ncbi:MAG: polynucleotide 5'-hydroxyl-kinase [Desulfobacterota bacterium]|nr:polynucleotide 5'-hydroxyl-kinase [Thermodesulfobacteriota bacterium]